MMLSGRDHQIRLAVRKDFVEMRDWDEFWGDRRQEMQRGEIYVATDSQDTCVGYVRVAHNEFLNYPLVAALCVRPDQRRRRIALHLLEFVKQHMRGLSLFCTTEEGNEEMLPLLLKAGFRQVGHVDHLNSDGSRELIFYLNTVEA